MDMRSRLNTVMRRMVASAAACGATLLIVTSVAGQEATPEELGAIDVPAEAEVLAVATTEEPFQITVHVPMAQAQPRASATFVVPAGKRLVVENLAGLGASTAIQSVTVTQSFVIAVLPPKIINTVWKWIGTTPTKVRFNAGTVSVTLERSAPSGICATCTLTNYITITGYLIPQ